VIVVGGVFSLVNHSQEHGGDKGDKADCQGGIEGGVDSRFHWAASIHRLSSPARMRGRLPVGLTVCSFPALIARLIVMVENPASLAAPASV
jgi:hypothetical protein